MSGALPTLEDRLPAIPFAGDPPTVPKDQRVSPIIRSGTRASGSKRPEPPPTTNR
jgi:hypothetical protein